MKILLVLLICLILGCSENKSKPDEQTLDFGLFIIKTPVGWKKIELKGIDSYAGRIAIDDRDTLEFDLGWHANRLNEYDPIILDSSMMQSVDSSYLSSAIFVKDRRMVDPDLYRKNNISWDTIDGRKVKIINPIRSGIGITGIYIDSVWGRHPGIDAFNLYGENLKPANDSLLREALQTLKFKRSK